MSSQGSTRQVGGLSYKIAVKDEFSTTLKLFREGLKGIRRDFRALVTDLKTAQKSIKTTSASVGKARVASTKKAVKAEKKLEKELENERKMVSKARRARIRHDDRVLKKILRARAKIQSNFLKARRRTLRRNSNLAKRLRKEEVAAEKAANAKIAADHRSVSKARRNRRRRDARDAKRALKEIERTDRMVSKARRNRRRREARDDKRYWSARREDARRTRKVEVEQRRKGAARARSIDKKMRDHDRAFFAARRENARRTQRVVTEQMRLGASMTRDILTADNEHRVALRMNRRRDERLATQALVEQTRLGSAMTRDILTADNEHRIALRMNRVRDERLASQALIEQRRLGSGMTRDIESADAEHRRALQMNRRHDARATEQALVEQRRLGSQMTRDIDLADAEHRQALLMNRRRDVVLATTAEAEQRRLGASMARDVRAQTNQELNAHAMNRRHDARVLAQGNARQQRAFAQRRTRSRQFFREQLQQTNAIAAAEQTATRARLNAFQQSPRGRAISAANRSRAREQSGALLAQEGRDPSGNRLRNTVAQIKKAEGSINRISFSFRRLIGIFAVFQGIRIVVGSFRSLVSDAVKLNAELETASNGLAAIFVASSDVRDTQGNMLSSQEAFAGAVAISREQIRLLRIEGLRTNATFAQLVKTYQSAAAPGREAGLSPDEIRKVTIRIAQAASAVGVPQNQLDEEVRSLISGTATSRTTRLSQALGGAKEFNKGMRAAREAGTVFEFLNGKLEAFATAGEASLNTFAGALSNAKDAVAIVSQTAALEFFTELKGLLLDVQGVARSEEDGIFEVNPEALNTAKLLFDGLASAATKFRVALADENLFEDIAPAFDVLGQSLDGAASVLIGAVRGFTKGLRPLSRLLGVVEEQSDDIGLSLEHATEALAQIVTLMVTWGLTFGAVITGIKAYRAAMLAAAAATVAAGAAAVVVEEGWTAVGTAGAAAEGSIAGVGATSTATFGSNALLMLRGFVSALFLVAATAEIASRALSGGEFGAESALTSLASSIDSSIDANLLAIEFNTEKFKRDIGAISEEQFQIRKEALLKQRRDVADLEKRTQEQIAGPVGRREEGIIQGGFDTLLGRPKAKDGAAATAAEKAAAAEKVRKIELIASMKILKAQVELAKKLTKETEDSVAALREQRAGGGFISRGNRAAAIKNEESIAPLVAKRKDAFRRAFLNPKSTEAEVVVGLEQIQQLTSEILRLTEGITAENRNSLQVQLLKAAVSRRENIGILEAQTEISEINAIGLSDQQKALEIAAQQIAIKQIEFDIADAALVLLQEESREHLANLTDAESRKEVEADLLLLAKQRGLLARTNVADQKAITAEAVAQAATFGGGLGALQTRTVIAEIEAIGFDPTRDILLITEQQNKLKQIEFDLADAALERRKQSQLLFAESRDNDADRQVALNGLREIDAERALLSRLNAAEQAKATADAKEQVKDLAEANDAILNRATSFNMDPDSAERRENLTSLSENGFGGSLDAIQEAFFQFAHDTPNEFGIMIDTMKGMLEGFSDFAADAFVNLFDPSDTSSIQEKLGRLLQGMAKQIISALIRVALVRSALKLTSLFGGGAAAASQEATTAFSDQALNFSAGGGYHGGLVGPQGVDRSFGSANRGFAHGGPVRGARRHHMARPQGLHSADTIPIWARDGESILQPSAVRKYGARFVKALNEGMLPANPLRALAETITVSNVQPVAKAGFATGGGVVAAPVSSAGVQQSASSGPSPAFLVANDQALDRMLAGGKNAQMSFMRRNRDSIKQALGIRR